MSGEVMATETRYVAPAHFLATIEPFSLLYEYSIEEYETKEFDAGNYKWKLRIYPNGDGTGKEGEYLSVNLLLSGTNFPSPEVYYGVNVVFSIFIFNYKSLHYHYTPGQGRGFYNFDPECCISKFMLKKDLTAPSNGFVSPDDVCMFGAEICIVDGTVGCERLTLKRDFVPYKHPFKISDLSTFKDYWCSEEFNAAGYKWEIHVCPKDIGCKFYIVHVASDKNTKVMPSSDERVMARYTFCVINQLSSVKDRTFTGNPWFGGSSVPWLKPTFLLIEGFNDADSGYVVNDTCRLEIEMFVPAVAE